MVVTSIKTHKFTEKDTDLLRALDQYVVDLQENSVVAVTSKIVSICEGSFVPVAGTDKDALIQSQAQYYLPRETNPYHVSLTITRNTLAASAGIDESNAFGNFILWPKYSQQSANMIREHLAQKFGIKNLGVIITDSKTTPLRWGVTAIAIAHSGFNALKDYIDTPDVFGRNFVFEKTNIADNLACAATVVMGEGAEQTPLAIITDIPFVEFQDRNPTEEELNSLIISKEEDLYSPLLNAVQWKKGKK